MNVHETRATFCHACTVLLSEQGFIAEDEIPNIKDFMGLDVATLASQYKFDKDFLDSKERRRVNQIIREIGNE